MSDTKKFILPDLGEGLPDATIVEWFVKDGDVIRLDDNLVSMETAKAVVEVPSPVSGKVLKLAGEAGDIVVTGACWPSSSSIRRPAAARRGPGHRPPPRRRQKAGKAATAWAARTRRRTTGWSPPARAARSSTTTAHRPSTSPSPAAMAAAPTPAPWSARCRVRDAVRSEQAIAVGGVKAMPAVRAMARSSASTWRACAPPAPMAR